ncbi:MAG: aminotransferase class V-fold PLP-dependent enzyme [Acidimicrobiia bacterium]|nr:aminotransferase class V-fold PLP-dependent enzyme [Acidimicrobiia bacterium]
MSDFAAWRDLFPALGRFAYLNWAGVGAVSTRASHAACAQLDRLRDEGGLASDVDEVVTQSARRRVADLTRVADDEIALVTNTTQGLGWVATGLDLGPGDRVVVQGGTFPSVLYPWLALEDRGVQVDVVAPTRTRGAPTWPVELFGDILRTGPEPRVVAVSWIDYAAGFEADLEGLGALARGCGALLCADIVQGFGVKPLDLGALPVDFAAAGSHKWVCSPAGAGFLYVSRHARRRLRPVEAGWNSVLQRGDYADLAWAPDTAARALEGGTPNVVAVAAYGAALDFIAECGSDAVWERVVDLAGICRDEVRRRGFDLLSSDEQVESGIVTFATGEDPESIAARAREQDVFVAAPRAGGVRVSLHAWNDAEDLERLFAVIDT